MSLLISLPWCLCGTVVILYPKAIYQLNYYIVPSTVIPNALPVAIIGLSCRHRSWFDLG